MDIVELRPVSHLVDEIKQLIKILHLPHTPLQLKGSASLQSQRYFSDYDFFSNVPHYPVDEAWKLFNEIRSKLLEKPDVYLIEIKLQGKKKERFHKEPIDKEVFYEMYPPELIKFDLVDRISGIFTSVSCIYSFTKEAMTKEDFIKSLQEEIVELKKEGMWYKVLKRQFAIYKAENDKEKLVSLSGLFNSPLGLAYQKVANIDAILEVLGYYKDKDTMRKIKLNLKDIHLKSIASLQKERKKLYGLINPYAKSVYEDL
jgi:hypothetical protein